MNNRPIQVPPVRHRTDLGPRGFDPDSTFRLPAARIGAGDSRRYVRVAAALDSVDERWHGAYCRHLAARFIGSGIFALDANGGAVPPPAKATVISVDRSRPCRPLVPLVAAAASTESKAASHDPSAVGIEKPPAAHTPVSLVRSVLTSSTGFFRSAGRGRSPPPPPTVAAGDGSAQTGTPSAPQQQQAFTIAAAFTPRVFAAMLAAFEIASAAILARAAVAGSAAGAAASADGKAAKAKAKAAAATTSIFATNQKTAADEGSQSTPASPTSASFFQSAAHSIVSSATPRATERLDAAYWAVLSAGALANTAASTAAPPPGCSSVGSSQSGALSVPIRLDSTGALSAFDIPPPPVWYPLLEDLRIDVREALVLAGFGTVKVSDLSRVEDEDNLLEAAFLAWARRAATATATPAGKDAASDPLAALWLSQMLEVHDDVRAFWLCKRAAIGASLFPPLRRQPVEPRGGFAPTANWTSPTASQQQQQQLGVAHALARNSMVNEPFHDEPFLFRELRDIAVHWRPDIIVPPPPPEVLPAADAAVGDTPGAADEGDDACSTHSSLSSFSGDDDDDDDSDLGAAELGDAAAVSDAMGGGVSRRRHRDEEDGGFIGGVALTRGCDPTVYAYARRARALARAVLVREQLRLEHIELALAELAFVRAAATDAATFDHPHAAPASSISAVASCGGVAEGTLRGLAAFGADLGVNYHPAALMPPGAAAYDADDAVVTAAPRDATTGRPHFAADHALHVVSSLASIEVAADDGAPKSLAEARRAKQRDAAVAAELLRVGNDE